MSHESLFTLITKYTKHRIDPRDVYRQNGILNTNILYTKEGHIFNMTSIITGYVSHGSYQLKHPIRVS